MSKIKPLKNKVLVRVNEAKTEINGIALPESVTSKNKKYIVEELGDGDFPFKVGDEIVLPKVAGVSLKRDNVDYIVVDLDEVLGYIE